MFRPVQVSPREGYRLWLRYEDGVEGVVDLSDFVGRGVFKAWHDLDVFNAVRIGDTGAVEWPGGLDLCPDALYLRLTGRTPEEVFPHLRSAGADA